jgi:hypothetical protein
MSSDTNLQLVDGEVVDLTGEPQQKAKWHARADTLAHSFGSVAPSPAVSESSLQYRKRVAAFFQPLSPDWSSADLRPVPKNTFERIEAQIYNDAAREALQPTKIPPGTMVERISTDETGRRIKSYFGDPEACWGPFKVPPKRVIGLGSK